MMSNGKGDSRRPRIIDEKTLEINWNNTFVITGGHTPKDSSGSQHAQHAGAGNNQSQRNNYDNE